MEIKRLDTFDSTVDIKDNSIVKCVEMGNITSLQYMPYKNDRQVIQMLEGGEEYLVLSTGEIKEINHYQSRADSKNNLYRTFRRMRELINSNVTDVENVRWITLTYRWIDGKPMTDSKKLYNDFKKFNMRFQYHCEKMGYGKPEYIVMMEPQGSGAWHAHLLYIWDTKAPYIANDMLAKIWSHGFVTIKKLDNVDNVGAYLTAYLGDMELEEFKNCSDKISNKNKQYTINEVVVDGKKKAFVKGARLNFYPPSFQMVRHSKGVKEPIISNITEYEAKKKVRAATLTYEKTLELRDEASNYSNLINTRYYNKIRGKSKDI